MGQLGQKFVPSSDIGLGLSGRHGLRNSGADAYFAHLDCNSRFWIDNILPCTVIFSV